MEENTTAVLTISSLIKSGRPFTAASSLAPSRPIDLRNRNPCFHKPIHQNPNLQTLKPLKHSALLIGTVNLPSSPNRSSLVQNCNCFQFSDDDSAAICCEILNFDPKMIGQKIRIFAWNFIPFVRGRGGFLEIIQWGFFEPCGGSRCNLPDFSCFCLSLGDCDLGDRSTARRLIFGVITAISPVASVPWAGRGGDSGGVDGFLVHILVCQCKYCASKHLVSELSGLCERNVEDHRFVQGTIVYFCGVTSSWHPAISRLIGDVVLVMGLKKKLVYLRKEESQLMYLAADSVSLHVAKLPKELCLTQNADIRGKGECGSYTGVITGIYMDGLIIELDQDVILLLTDKYLAFPHYVRVGVLVTLKNVHFVNPHFPWAKMLILGACTRTSMHVESFSPLESWSHLKQQSPSLLQKFINSLPYAARLALLVVSCFQKMFAGTLSVKDILGSQHEEGLAQKYASSHFPSSAFQARHGVLLEFCRHDLCSGGKEVDCCHLRLVLPIGNLVSYCEVVWKKVLNFQENCFHLMGGINQKGPLRCGGRSYEQSIRRVLRSEEIGVVVLGTLKISSSSGRLQLVDATGSVDIMLNLPETWNFKRIFEMKDFRLIMESTCPELIDLNPTTYQPLSCRSIFSNALPSRKLNIPIYLYHCPSDEDSRSRSLFFDWKRNSQDLNSGKYHLLWLIHKFPIQQKFLGDLAKRPNMFAEAIVFPWDLLVSGKYSDATTTRSFSGHWRDSFKNIAAAKELPTLKRCKSEHTSYQVYSCCMDDTGSGLESKCCSNNGIELSCRNTGEGENNHWMGMLHCAGDRGEVVSSCKPPMRKVLLGFGSDYFSKYELLKIGCCYLVKHEEGDMLCCKDDKYQVSRAKVFISSGTFFRSLTLSSIQGLQSADLPDGFPYCNLRVSDDELTKGFCKFEIPCLISNSTGSESYSDINIFVPSSAVNLLENFMKMMDCISNEPRHSFEGESSINDHNGSMINSSMQSSGTSCSDYPLPQGNLITLRGLVVAFHDCHGVDFLAQPGRCLSQGSKLMFLREKTGVCVHVLLDNHTVSIFCDRSKEICPIGLGRDVYATFHRVLVLSELDKYMMTAVSFITVDHASLMREHHNHDLSDASRTVDSHVVASHDTVSIALISDALQLSELRPMRFRCKVVSMYILVLEKAGSTEIFQSRVQSIRSGFGIPLTGFIIDDGSSSCCCWADSENAATVLGLDLEEYSLKVTLMGYKAGKGQRRISTVSRLNQALERHGRISVKNCSSMFDSSCQDLEFVVESKRSLSRSDEDNLQSLITNALLTTSWRVDASFMDPEKTAWLEECLSQLNVNVPPLLNIWATRVCRTDALAEARSIIQELV
ncbi:CST complex subunit CTC1-like isoform X2 [Salvia splendens]|uniref:CST complex subunit CTC1-like isoform X2 n=1 Tax=Salvia splendens TaxID=180675 RepID=UPI001C26F720|nr:CST complex subunit CTC1-like isoform X2 [Salvia splendens]